MRKHLFQDFTRLYHLHLEGNVRQNPTLSGTAYNVFGIQVGVGITLAVRSSKQKDHRLFFNRLDKNLRREQKLAWLEEHERVAGVDWQELTPDTRHTWLVPENAETFSGFLAMGSKAGKGAKTPQVGLIFQSFSLGVATHRDAVVYDFNPRLLEERVKQFIEDYNAEVDRYRRSERQDRLRRLRAL